MRQDKPQANSPRSNPQGSQQGGRNRGPGQEKQTPGSPGIEQPELQREEEEEEESGGRREQDEDERSSNMGTPGSPREPSRNPGDR